MKEGKLARKDGQPMPGEDEPLHAFVSGPTLEAVALAVARVNILLFFCFFLVFFSYFILIFFSD